MEACLDQNLLGAAQETRPRGRPSGRFEENKNQVMLIIETFSRNTGYAWVGNKYLAQTLKCSIRQIQRYISALVKEGRLTRAIKRYIKAVNDYKTHRLLIAKKSEPSMWGRAFNLDFHSLSLRIASHFRRNSLTEVKEPTPESIQKDYESRRILEEAAEQRVFEQNTELCDNGVRIPKGVTGVKVYMPREKKPLDVLPLNQDEWTTADFLYYLENK